MQPSSSRKDAHFSPPFLSLSPERVRATTMEFNGSTSQRDSCPPLATCRGFAAPARPARSAGP
eukprot:scaffold16890_cov110-Isochrysis_galbana.AAC.4